MAESFVHLHVHSDFSILDGCQTIQEIVDKAVENKQQSIAVTDHGTIGNFVALEKKCKEKGLQHIHGVEVYVTEDRFEKSDHRYHLVLLAKNNVGLKNIFKITSASFTEGFYRRPRIDLKLLREYKDGIIVLSACASGLISNFVLKEDMDRAVKLSKWMLREFGGDFYYELMPLVGRKDKEGKKMLDEQRKVNAGLLELHKELGIPIVATNDAHYANKEDYKAQDVLLCVQTKKKITDIDRWRFDLVELHLKTREEMEQSFKLCYPDIPKKKVTEALNNSVFISLSCLTEVERKKNLIPAINLPSGMTNVSFLQSLVKKAWKPRLIDNGQLRRVADKKGFSLKSMEKVYKERLKTELEQIERQGFVDYFLVVWDLYQWVHKQDIMCGPGRGSSAGSLVCFLLGITQIDPLEYDLWFTRFIAPDRVTSPDIDMDFEDAKRDSVKAYLVEKWGRENTSSVGTYGTQKGKQALKDVGRVFGVPWQETQKVTDLIIQRAWGDARVSYTIMDTFEQFDAAKEYLRKYPDVVKYAMKFEGRIRQRGIHASGVEVAPFPLTDIIPIETTGHGKVREVITGVDHREADELGLVKLDVLGLATLTVVKQTIDLVKERTGKEVDLYSVDRDDPLVFEKFTEGKCAGIFQVNTIGFIKMCMEAPMRDVDDLAVVLALYRPGAMRSGLAQDYLKRSQGKSKVKTVHPIYDDITKDTAGCIIYQEQVMAFFSKMADWSASEVDAGRRTMAKSYGVDKLNEERPKFIKGALDNPEYMNGLTDEQRKEPESVANRIYDMILHFGSYGFNKSHAVAYAMISYWTMWLKVHHPNEFYAVLLSREPDDDNIRRFITEMRQEGIKLLPPDINKSQADFSLDKDGVRAGLAKIKNVGENAVAAIIEARPYKNMDDFISRVNRRIVNKRVIANLIKVGAFSQWYSDRAELLAKFEVITGKKGKSVDDVEVNVESWDEETFIRMVTSIYPIPTEKHITEYYGDVLDGVIRKFVKIEDMEEHINEVVYVCGTIQDIKFNRVGDFDLKEKTEEQKKASKNYGKRYANINIEDGTGYRRHKFSVDGYSIHQGVLEKGEGTPVIVKARVDKQRDINYILDLTELDDFRERLREGIPLTPFQQSLVKNPLEPYAALREAYDIPYIEDLDTSLKSLKIMGEVAYTKEYHARNGLMLFAGLEDETGYFDLIVWADAYTKFEKYLKMGSLAVVKASRVKDGKYAVDIGKDDRIVLAKTMLRRLK